MSWQWRMIQKLNRNWLVVFKLTWGTLQILTWAFKKICVLIDSLWPQYLYNIWPKKVQRSYLSWHWKVMQILKKNWLVVWRMTWEIWQIFTRALESVKIGTWWDPFVQSRKGMTLKFTGELCVMIMKNNAKVEEELTFHFKTDKRNLTNFDSSTRKSRKIAV